MGMTESKHGSALDVQELSVSFVTADSNSKVVDNASFTVQPGAFVAILGESGSGKTATIRAIMDVLPDNSLVSAMRLKLGETELQSMTESQRRRLRGKRISMVMQDALSALNPVLRIGDQIGDILKAHTQMSKKDRRVRAIELLGMVGITNPEIRVDDYPHRFSGGMRQRILIAMAIALEPDVLIADEPTTALDVTVQAQILRLLDDLRRRLGMAILMITHDIGVVMEVADQLIIMHDGKIVEKGVADAVFAKPSEDYTRRLFSSMPRSEEPRVLNDSAEVVLAVNDVSKSFRSGGLLHKSVTRAVDGITFELRAGETIGIVGESGSGKSTLARLISGLESVDRGSIRFKDQEVARRVGRRRSASLSGVEMIFQDPYSSLNPRMSIEDVVAEPLRVIGEDNRATRRERVRNLLEVVGMPPEVLRRFPHQLSGGQRQRISIARALIRDPEVLICDEPVSALDVTVQAQVVKLLTDIQDRVGVAMLFISHDLSVVRNLAHRVIVMNHGKIVEQGDVRQIFDAPQDEYTKKLLDSVPPTSREDRGTIIPLMHRS